MLDKVKDWFKNKVQEDVLIQAKYKAATKNMNGLYLFSGDMKKDYSDLIKYVENWDGVYDGMHMGITLDYLPKFDKMLHVELISRGYVLESKKEIPNWLTEGDI
jgi:hypothetical protein